MTTQIKCRIWWDDSIQAYRISVPYDAKFIDFLKVAIPVAHRAFDPSTKIWTFAEQYFDPVKNTAEKVWGKQDVTTVSKAQTQQATAPPSVQKASMDEIFVQWCKLLTPDAFMAAYRKAATELHPDKGGDMEKMARLNVLWERIKKEHLKQ